VIRAGVQHGNWLNADMAHGDGDSTQSSGRAFSFDSCFELVSGVPGYKSSRGLQSVVGFDSPPPTSRRSAFRFFRLQIPSGSADMNHDQKYGQVSPYASFLI